MVESIALGVGDINIHARVTGLYTSSEIMLSGGTFHLCHLSKSAQSPRFPGGPRWTTCGSQSTLVPYWRLSSRKPAVGPVSPQFSGRSLEVVEEGTRGGGWAQTAPHSALLWTWGPRQVGLSQALLARVRRSGAKVSLLVKVTATPETT